MRDEVTDCSLEGVLEQRPQLLVLDVPVIHWLHSVSKVVHGLRDLVPVRLVVQWNEALYLLALLRMYCNLPRARAISIT